MPQSGQARAFMVGAAALGWTALALQFFLSMRFGQGGLGGLLAFFGYFTVLTNLLVACALTAGAVGARDRRTEVGVDPGAGRGAHGRLLQFFQGAGVNTAIAASIILVGATYSLVLRQTWNPQGLQRVADALLHDVMPLVFLIYWWALVPKASLRWSAPIRWMVYPVAYFVYALVLGASGWRYPYPFIDVSVLGYPKVMVNAIVVLAAFGAVSLGLIALGHASSRRSVRSHTRHTVSGKP